MTKPYTPGPWWVDHRLMGGCLHIYADGGRIQVARVNGRAGEQEANAALISAAPKLLAACEAAHHLLDSIDDSVGGLSAEAKGAVHMLRAAIEKARGVR